jgi:hypothetical protein
VEELATEEVMAELTDDEIAPGLVSWLDQVALNENAAVEKTARFLGDPEPRPFVCFARDGATSSWAPITGQHRKERLLLKPEWRVGGNARWTGQDQYLVDGANTYSGSNADFISAAEDLTERGNRRALTEDGLTAVLEEVGRQVRRRR